MKKIGIWVIVLVVLGGLFGSTIVLNMDTIRDNAPNDIEATILKDDLASFGALVYTYGQYYKSADQILVYYWADQKTVHVIAQWFDTQSDEYYSETKDFVFGTTDGAKAVYNILEPFHDYGGIPEPEKPLEAVLNNIWDVLAGIFRTLQLIGSAIGMVIVLLFDSFAVVWELIQYCFALLGV